MPDIDIDFDDVNRQKVIDYVVDKYGKTQVAQIITFGTMAAKSSIKDVARAMELRLPADQRPHQNGARQARHHPGQAFDEVPGAACACARADDLKGTILRLAEQLEGSVRNTGIHAAGVIIAPDDITKYIPVQHLQRFGPARDAVRRQGDRECGHAEDGLPGPQNPDHHRGCPRR